MHDAAIMIPIIALLMPVLIIAVILRYKARMTWMRYQRDGDHTACTARINELAHRLEKIERRMANLETIVLDAEKMKNFDRSL